MALARGRRGGSVQDFWPGYVDILSTLLLVVTFLMSLFMITQFFVSQESSGKDVALKRLTAQIAQLTELLALERTNKQASEDELAALSASLAQTEAEKKKLSELIALGDEKAGAAQSRAAVLETDLETQKEISEEALARVNLLNQQLLALRRQIAALEAALDAAEAKDKESQTRIADLGQRLNVALAKKVQELSQYRSEFFGKLRQALANRQDVRVVGDRFVFQAEVLFPSGSDVINPEGLATLDSLAQALNELEGKIPKEVNWVLRVDGHTDRRPISTPIFRSNWELSSARAIAVVKFLISRGIPANRLVAAGFGENQPIEPGESEDAFAKNRRIELKLTER
ncbi:MAG: peptidoglycan -binding protein [Hyphomicrobiaceae bacterium]